MRGKKIKVNKRQDYGKIEINFSDKSLFNKFKEAGFPVGKKGTGLRVPPNLLNNMKEIISGYFATDGSFVITSNNGTMYPRIEFSSISKLLLEQVKEYLDSLGISGKVYLSKKYKNGWCNLYRLQINGKKKLILFRKEIGFVNPKHEDRFKKFYDNFINSC
ncbi:MAG: LAGLIDADG family homing endonuclease [Candidatus Woesearchaeota archaeon]